MKSKANGSVKEDINSKWGGEKYEIERERLLFRLTRIEQNSSDTGYFGCGNCKLCGTNTPYGSKSYGGIEWSIDIQHYIEIHGHKPSDNEMQAINLLFEEIKMSEEAKVRQGLFKYQNK